MGTFFHKQFEKKHRRYRNGVKIEFLCGKRVEEARTLEACLKGAARKHPSQFVRGEKVRETSVFEV